MRGRQRKKQWIIWEVTEDGIICNDVESNLSTELAALRMFNSTRKGVKATGCIKDEFNNFVFNNLSGTVGGLILKQEGESNGNQTCINQ